MRPPTILPTTASPPIAAAQSFAAMLGESEQWRALTADYAASWPDDAPNGVFLRMIPGDINPPWASVQPAAELSAKLLSGGGQNYLRWQGALLCVMATPIPPELANDPVATEVNGLDAHAGVLGDVVANSANDERLSIVEVTLLQAGPPPVEDQPSVGLYFESVWMIRWGDE